MELQCVYGNPYATELTTVEWEPIKESIFAGGIEVKSEFSDDAFEYIIKSGGTSPPPCSDSTINMLGFESSTGDSGLYKNLFSSTAHTDGILGAVSHPVTTISQQAVGVGGGGFKNVSLSNFVVNTSRPLAVNSMMANVLNSKVKIQPKLVNVNTTAVAASTASLIQVRPSSNGETLCLLSLVFLV